MLFATFCRLKTKKTEKPFVLYYLRRIKKNNKKTENKSMTFLVTVWNPVVWKVTRVWRFLRGGRSCLPLVLPIFFKTDLRLISLDCILDRLTNAGNDNTVKLLLSPTF